MTKYLMLILSLVIMSIGMAFGVEVEPLPGQGIADKILEFISSGTGAVVIAAVVEFGLRFVKSEKALSLIYLASGMLKMVGNLFSKVGEFLDKVLPQRLKK